MNSLVWFLAGWIGFPVLALLAARVLDFSIVIVKGKVQP